MKKYGQPSLRPAVRDLARREARAQTDARARAEKAGKRTKFICMDSASLFDYVSGHLSRRLAAFN